MSFRAISFDLILITEPELAEPVRFMRDALQGASAGRVAVQLRAKEWSADQRRDAADRLHEIVIKSQCLLLINGEPQLCVDVNAHGVQLPVAGPTVVDARAMIGRERWIGSSCHDQDELTRAELAGADFALLSPWNTVPHKRAALGPERFRSLTHDAQIPIFALGGLSLADINHVIAHGAHGVAVIREVHQAADPARWVESALLALSDARSPGRFD